MNTCEVEASGESDNNGTYSKGTRFEQQECAHTILPIPRWRTENIKNNPILSMGIH
jgi:hypothetical protein